ncbi:MAG TPA: hypothetical protein VFN28_01300 [Amaricoccus sp.]|jgi:hypothetical protein|nr:hypothetical protein [Amaricoccus sp.]
MTDNEKRIDVRKLDAATVDRISSEIVRSLAASGGAEPQAAGRLHLRFGHIRSAPHSRNGFSKVVIDMTIDDEPDPS